MSNNVWFTKLSWSRNGDIGNIVLGRVDYLLLVLFLVFFTYVSATIFASFGLFGYSYDKYDQMQMKAKVVQVSQNMPVGTVVSEPQELGEGLFLVQIQMDSSNTDKPSVYPAITAFPEQFPIGSKATMRNVTASGKMVSGDMFHIAVKPKETKGD